MNTDTFISIYDQFVEANQRAQEAWEHFGEIGRSGNLTGLADATRQAIAWQNEAQRLLAELKAQAQPELSYYQSMTGASYL